MHYLVYLGPAIVLVIFIWLIARTRNMKKLIENGMPVDAKILKVLSDGTNTGGTSGTMFETLLEISLPGQAPFQVKKMVYVPINNAFTIRPGNFVKAVVDPKSRKVAIPGTDDQL